MAHTKPSTRLLCLVLVMLLAAALTLTGCAKQPSATEPPATEPAATEPAVTEPAKDQTANEVGEGEITFNFDVTFKDGSEEHYVVHTDMTTVGGALYDLQLIDGELGDYGLYVTTVCGEFLDWNTDQMYWALYENGEYGMNGVDTTEIVDGGTYALVATPG